jgi:hypothetical protein
VGLGVFRTRRPCSERIIKSFRKFVLLLFGIVVSLLSLGLSPLQTDGQA